MRAGGRAARGTADGRRGGGMVGDDMADDDALPELCVYERKRTNINDYR